MKLLRLTTQDNLHISALQKNKDISQGMKHTRTKEKKQERYRNIRNQLRKEIKKTKPLFCKNPLSSKPPQKVGKPSNDSLTQVKQE